MHNRSRDILMTAPPAENDTPDESEDTAAEDPATDTVAVTPADD